MAFAVDRAPLGAARCALTLVTVARRIRWLESRLCFLEMGDAWFAPGAAAEWHDFVDEQNTLLCAAALLEAALRWQCESLHTAALETFR